MNKLSLIIPVYKQEKTVKKDLEMILVELRDLRIGYEVIAVVDGQVDRSRSEANKIRNKHLVVTGYPSNHGKGYAVRYGFAKAKGNIIGFLDAGGDLNPSVIPFMLEQMEWLGADIIVGSKRHPDSMVHYPFWRKVLSWGYQQCIRVLFGLNIRDTQVGLKIYKRNVLESVLPRLLVKQFAFDVEILSVAYRLGYRKIFESPIELSYKFTSSITSVNFWKIVLSMLKDTLAVFYRLRILRYYDDGNKRIWRFDPELNFKINIG
jgi:glycosyltransferase involved in cell wall biosynthesis